jgi:hypothetical protein
MGLIHLHLTLSCVSPCEVTFHSQAFYFICIGGVMVSVLAWSVVECGFIGGVMVSVLAWSVVDCKNYILWKESLSNAGQKNISTNINKMNNPHWTQRPNHLQIEIQVLAWERHKKWGPNHTPLNNSILNNQLLTILFSVILA